MHCTVHRARGERAEEAHSATVGVSDTGVASVEPSCWRRGRSGYHITAAPSPALPQSVQQHHCVNTIVSPSSVAGHGEPGDHTGGRTSHGQGLALTARVYREASRRRAVDKEGNGRPCRQKEVLEEAETGRSYAGDHN
jgi:hypothetical protein